MNAQEFNQAKKIILRLLRIRDRSEKEIWHKLTQKKISLQCIKYTVRYFKDLHLIDDRQFARNWISSRLKKPFGLKRIRLELTKKGIADEILTQEFERIATDYCEPEIVARLANERVLKYGAIEKSKIIQRVYNYLMRRGFSEEAVNKAINEIKI